jgi:hypothetical protein
MSATYKIEGVNMSEKEFSNTFTDWAESHYEISCLISNLVSEEDPSPRLKEVMEKEGTSGLYGLSIELTDLFERDNQGREWDGEWLTAVYDFVLEQLGVENE